MGKKMSVEGSQISLSIPFLIPMNFSKLGAMAGCPEISAAYVGDTAKGGGGGQPTG